MNQTTEILNLTMNQRSKIFQRYFKGIVSTIHVKKDGAWIELSGSADINGTFTQNELEALKEHGYNPGSNFLCFNFEDQTRFIKHWIHFGKVKVGDILQ